MSSLSRLSLYLLLILGCYCRAQTPHAIWEDQVNGGYKYVMLDAATGAKTNISSLPPVTGFVMGDASAVNYDLDRYYLIAQVLSNRVLFTLDLNTGAVLSSPQMTYTVVGIEYNCADSLLYGIAANGNNYYFVKIDPATAALTNVAAIGNMQGYVGGSFSLDLAAQVYTFKALTSTVFKLRSLDVATGAVLHDNPFPDNVVGQKYSPTDNKTYGMWENPNTSEYQLEEIDYTTGAHSMVTTYSVITPGYVGESVSMNQNGEYTFRGFDKNNNYALFTLDCTTGAILHYSNTSDNAVGFEEPVCITGTTGIDISKENSLAFYPNPASDNITIETPEPGMLQIFDALGRKVLSQELRTTKENISVKLLPKGIYDISFSSGGNILRKRLILLK